MLIYLSTWKDARDCLDQSPIAEYTRPGGLRLLWRLRDEAFGESEEEQSERAELRSIPKASRTACGGIHWPDEAVEGSVSTG